MIVLPIIVDGQTNGGDQEITIEDLYDFVPRNLIFYKKGKFFDFGDTHRYYINFKSGIDYVARIKVTSIGGGTFDITIQGITTSSTNSGSFGSTITDQVLEVTHTADSTGTGHVTLTYVPNAALYKPEFTLYLNKTGFAGWWWIILSGLGTLAILAFLVTFSIIGIKSVSKGKKKKKEKKKKRK
ncbi:MAG: hypothetical protein ACTSPC_13035 [Candidatus Heimdallarchaeota archaeon]